MTAHRDIAWLVALVVALPAVASANGLGEDRPYQFRSTNERQVLLNLERTRLELQGEFRTNTGVGSGAGLGTQQTGNSTIININGSNNQVTVSQTNSGAQTITQTNSNNSILNN